MISLGNASGRYRHKCLWVALGVSSNGSAQESVGEWAQPASAIFAMLRPVFAVLWPARPSSTTPMSFELRLCLECPLFSSASAFLIAACGQEVLAQALPKWSLSIACKWQVSTGHCRTPVCSGCCCVCFADFGHVYPLCVCKLISWTPICTSTQEHAAS